MTREEQGMAIFIRGHLRLLAAGMRNSRHSGAEILDKAARITGTAYKRGQYQRAIEDLTNLINGAKNDQA